ncbi:hypothetical protein HY501_01390 [Candidatus Woesearchaeota archaeon]|nr:hypothetical protein [Candidatus Woesearchaeota archaeon]
MKGKKGQQQVSGVEISVFILLIALFLLIYIVLLPPAERESLLAEDKSSTAGSTEETGKVLLSESPGKLVTFSTNIHTAYLGPVRLFSKSEEGSIPLVASVSVSRHLFKNNFKDVFFDLGDIQEPEQVRLLALIKEKKGSLKIMLNGKLVFEGVLTAAEMPVNLPLNYLSAGENRLTFESSSPGFNLFSTNYYLFQDISLLVSTKVEKTEASKRLLIDPELDGQVRKASLRYFVSCNTLEEGRLSIRLNGDEIFDDQVFCSYLDERSISIDPKSLDDSNLVGFSIDKGDYTLENARVVLELTKSIFPTYALDIDSSLFKRIQDGTAKVVLKIAFAGAERKKAAVSVQEESFQLDTSAASYSKDITAMLDNGANIIKLTPQTTMEIVSLKVVEE